MKADLENKIEELLAWKDRQEQEQSDRLTEMRNAVIDAFMARHATVSEIQTVLELVRHEAISQFVNAQKEKMRISTKEYPAKIKE